MKIINQHKNAIQKIVLLGFLFVSNFSYSEAPPFDDDVQDVPASPIDNYVIIGLILAIVVVFVLFKSNRLQPKNQ